MKKLFVMVALGVLILAASCDTKNIGGTPLPLRGPIVTVNVPAGMNGGVNATWTVTWVGGTAPFTITMNMGGGANPNTWTEAGVTSPFTHTFTMVNPSMTDSANYTYTITVRDAQNLGRDWTGTYTVGPTLNVEATITAVYDNVTHVITATIGDTDGDPVAITAAATGNITVTPLTANVTAPYPATTTFTVAGTDLFANSAGEVILTATDGLVGHTGATATISAISIAPPVLNPDTLYAIPMANAAAVGTPVTVVIATGAPANNFLYLNGIGVTVQGVVDGANHFVDASGASYVPSSFDVGVPDATADAGGANPVDGVWSTLGTTSFIMAPDNLVDRGTDIGGGRVRIDFNLTPLDGAQSNTISGALFNFGMSFGVAGTYTLGFQQFAVVKRTYFSDAGAVEYFWGTLMADETGALAGGITINNAIVVN